MLLKPLSFMVLSISINMALLTSPLSLGMNILLLSSVMTSMISYMSSSWMAMKIFIIYIGGLLVLFAYFLAIQPNMFISILKPLTKASIMTTLTLYTVKTNTMISSTKSIILIPPIMLPQNFFMVTLLSLILLLILMVVASMSSASKSPLRPFNKTI